MHRLIVLAVPLALGLAVSGCYSYGPGPYYYGHGPGYYGPGPGYYAPGPGYYGAGPGYGAPGPGYAGPPPDYYSHGAPGQPPHCANVHYDYNGNPICAN